MLILRTLKTLLICERIRAHYKINEKSSGLKGLWGFKTLLGLIDLD